VPVYIKATAATECWLMKDTCQTVLSKVISWSNSAEL